MKSTNKLTSFILFLVAIVVAFEAQPAWSQWNTYLNATYAQCTINPRAGGLAVLPDGRVLVSTLAGLAYYPPFPSIPGQCPTTAPQPINTNIYGTLVIGLDGNVYGLYANPITSQTDIVQVNINGGKDKPIVNNTQGLGMTLDPVTGDLFLSSYAADRENIYRVTNFYCQNCTAQMSIWTTVPAAKFDGVAWSCDGKYLFVASPDTDELYRFDRLKGHVTANVPGGPDGVAVGASGTPFAGSVFTNNNYGTVTRIANLVSGFGKQAIIASGGQDGDFIFVDGQQDLVVIQGDHLQRLSSTLGGQWTIPGSSLCSTLSCSAQAATTQQIDREECLGPDEPLYASLVLTLSQTSCSGCESCSTVNQSRSSLIALLNYLDPPVTCLDGVKSAAKALSKSCPCNPDPNACPFVVACPSCIGNITELRMDPAIKRGEFLLGRELDFSDPLLREFLKK